MKTNPNPPSGGHERYDNENYTKVIFERGKVMIVASGKISATIMSIGIILIVAFSLVTLLK